MTAVNANVSAAQNYGITLPSPDSGADFVKAAPKVHVRPYVYANSSTRGAAMAWDNPQPGGASFMKFDDDNKIAAPKAISAGE